MDRPSLGLVELVFSAPNKFYVEWEADIKETLNNQKSTPDICLSIFPEHNLQNVDYTSLAQADIAWFHAGRYQIPRVR